MPTGRLLKPVEPDFRSKTTPVPLRNSSRNWKQRDNGVNDCELGWHYFSSSEQYHEKRGDVWGIKKCCCYWNVQTTSHFNGVWRTTCRTVRTCVHYGQSEWRLSTVIKRILLTSALWEETVGTVLVSYTSLWSLGNPLTAPDKMRFEFGIGLSRSRRKAQRVRSGVQSLTRSSLKFSNSVSHMWDKSVVVFRFQVKLSDDFLLHSI